MRKLPAQGRSSDHILKTGGFAEDAKLGAGDTAIVQGLRMKRAVKWWYTSRRQLNSEMFILEQTGFETYIPTRTMVDSSMRYELGNFAATLNACQHFKRIFPRLHDIRCNVRSTLDTRYQDSGLNSYSVLMQLYCYHDS